jgi:autotransporter strand-loop-strand O-heptosyltransferase
MKNPAFYTASLAIGDCICATPTIRKISETYNTKVIVFSHYPEIFENLPYVSESLDVKDYITLDKSEALRSQYDLHYSFWKMGRKVSLSDDRGIEMKHAMMDIRQYHAIDNGFMLKSSELHCDFVPRESEELPLPEKFVCLHPFKNWSSRTWSEKNWNILIKNLSELNIPIVIIGKDGVDSNLLKYLKEGVTGKTDDRVFDELAKKQSISNSLETFGIYDYTNKTSLSQAWNILNKSTCVVTMDSGILHLAGTTDTHILQLGSSIDPEYRAPYRKGSQKYKYSYLGGTCKLFCASNMKYSLRDWEHGYNGGTPLQSVTLIDTCLENKPTFECHPQSNRVFEEVQKLWNSIDNQQVITEKKEIKKRTLVEIQSNALGDSVGAMAIIEKYRIESGKDISVLCKFPELFRGSYPNLIIYKKDDIDVNFVVEEGTWYVNNIPHTEKINANYKFDVPLLDGYAKDFNITSDDVVLKVDGVNGERPIKAKYVCIGVHSTAQCKYWNHPGAWDELCKMLRKKGLTPVVVEKDFSFGIIGYMNEVPSKAVKKIGMSFGEVLNYIQHAEMFIGLSSGLTWVAQGLGKPTVIISNATSKDNEYIDDKTLRIFEESVCHGCFHKYPFNTGDWLWCPVYRNDEARRFICTKAITPESVMEQIENFYKI